MGIYCMLWVINIALYLCSYVQYYHRSIGKATGNVTGILSAVFVHRKTIYVKIIKAAIFYLIFFTLYSAILTFINETFDVYYK